ncbi:MAG: HAMP domain-containing histidine kinase [Arcobacteraceae bacterium]|nr:HAMP domain-containing histidine kinase [Arcobacteraceae bacterium]
MTEKQYQDKISSLERQLKALQNSSQKECEQHNKILTQQSKMAAMGEMIGNIAHQWRQPLMELSSILINTEAKIRIQENISNDEILEVINRSNHILKYMSNTIDDFRNFFAKDKEKTQFKISDQIKRTVNILSSTLDNKNIKVNIILKHNPTIYGYKNEYSQVLINIISNAKDVLVQRGIKNGLIEVKVYEQEGLCITEVLDNGGGISEKYIDDIFKPFMTFEKKDGTGIGLFMAKLIVENNMNGTLSASNEQNGAKFFITLPVY